MISDDELLLYYYRDGLDPADRRASAQRSASNPSLPSDCIAWLRGSTRPHRCPKFPCRTHVRQRWQAALERAAHGNATRATSTRHRFFATPHWQTAAAAVAVLALVLTVQLTMQSSPNGKVEESAPPSTGTVASTNEATAYERGLRWHLASTERQLTTLESATPDERARLIETIIAQNRMYALAAERAGEPQLARVLRAFAPILESLAGERR